MEFLINHGSHEETIEADWLEISKGYLKFYEEKDGYTHAVAFIELSSVKAVTRVSVDTLASADTYAHRCCVDPVGMGIMKDNGDGTLSIIRPKEFNPHAS